MMRVLRAWWRVLIAVRSSLGREGGVGGVIAVGSVMVSALRTLVAVGTVSI